MTARRLAVVALLSVVALPTLAESPTCFVDDKYFKVLERDGIELWYRRFCFGEGTDYQFSTCPRVVNRSGRERKLLLRFVARCADGSTWTTPESESNHMFLDPGEKNDVGAGWFWNADCFTPCGARILPVQMGWIFEDLGAKEAREAQERAEKEEAERRAEEARKAEVERKAQAEREAQAQRQAQEARRQDQVRRQEEQRVAAQRQYEEQLAAQRRREAEIAERIERRQERFDKAVATGNQYRDEMSKLANVSVGEGIRNAEVTFGFSFPAFVGYDTIAGLGMTLEASVRRGFWVSCGEEDRCIGPELIWRGLYGFGQEEDVVTGETAVIGQFRTDVDLGFWFGALGLFVHADAAQTSGDAIAKVETVRAGPGIALSMSHSKDFMFELQGFWTPWLDGGEEAFTGRLNIGIGMLSMAVQGTKTPAKGDRPEEWMVSFPFGMRFPW